MTSYRSLKGIFYESIDFKALERMKNLKHIMYEKFIYCSNTPAVKVCMPKVGNDGEWKFFILKKINSIYLMRCVIRVG